MWNLIVEVSIMSGGLVPLLAFILLGVIAVVIERFYFFQRVLKTGHDIEHDIKQVNGRNLDKLNQVAKHYEQSIQARILKTAVESANDDADTLDRRIEETILWDIPKLDKNIWLLDSAVTLGPLLGLFGTIIGMIESFSVLGTSGTGNPTAVTGGIGHALIATGGGLMIAIISVSFLNYFNKRIRLAGHQNELIKVMLINRLVSDAKSTVIPSEARQTKTAPASAAQGA